MKSTLYWILAVLITLSAAYYQRKTGPTYPKRMEITINGSNHDLRLIRSIEIAKEHNVKLSIDDQDIEAKLYYKRLGVNEEYTEIDFTYKVKPVDSFIMNKIFKMTEEKGFFAEVPVQPPAGKLEYYFSLTDKNGTETYFNNEPIIIRFKGAVPSKWLTPHIILMFFAMMLSTLTGLMAFGKHKSYKKYGLWTLILLFIGGMILGPIVQFHAFGEAWAGVPFGWDLTDNKTLVALIFWIIAVFANRKAKRPALSILAAVILLLIYSIPHSMFGSELDYETGKVIQGIFMGGII